MLRDHRPYRVKKAYLKLQDFYVEHFLRPQFTSLGKGHTFIRPWNVEVFGTPIEVGDYVNVIASRDRKVRLTVWTFTIGSPLSVRALPCTSRTTRG